MVRFPYMGLNSSPTSPPWTILLRPLGPAFSPSCKLPELTSIPKPFHLLVPLPEIVTSLFILLLQCASAQTISLQRGSFYVLFWKLYFYHDIPLSISIRLSMWWTAFLSHPLEITFHREGALFCLFTIMALESTWVPALSSYLIKLIGWINNWKKSHTSHNNLNSKILFLSIADK